MFHEGRHNRGRDIDYLDERPQEVGRGLSQDREPVPEPTSWKTLSEGVRNQRNNPEPTSWKFRLGDVVEYVDDEDARGVILQCKTSQEVDSGGDWNEPWYLMIWFVTIHDVREEKEEYSLGQEHEGRLRLVFRPEFGF